MRIIKDECLFLVMATVAQKIQAAQQAEQRATACQHRGLCEVARQFARSGLPGEAGLNGGCGG
ncbi:hypothetical protein D3C87_1195790 [compost metagenome]